MGHKALPLGDNRPYRKLRQNGIPDPGACAMAMLRQLSEEPLVLCVLVRLRRPDQRSLDGLRHAIEDNHALTSALSL